MAKIEISVSEEDLKTFNDAWKIKKKKISPTILSCLGWGKSETFFLDLMVYGLKKAFENTDAFIYSSLKEADGKHIETPPRTNHLTCYGCKKEIIAPCHITHLKLIGENVNKPPAVRCEKCTRELEHRVKDIWYDFIIVREINLTTNQRCPFNHGKNKPRLYCKKHNWQNFRDYKKKPRGRLIDDDGHFSNEDCILAKK